MNTDIRENRIYRYLLGDLPEAEQLALEQAVFADSEIFEQMWDIENRLVDGYVRGRLTPADKNLFEQNYLASPVHRERVAFARTLVQATDSGTQQEKAPTQTEPSISRWQSFLASFKGTQWRWAMAAVMLILTVSGAWLLSERARLREQVSQLQQQRASEQQRAEELEREMAREREQSDKLAAEVARLQEETQHAEKPVPTPTPVNERASIAAFFLSPKMLMRSGGEPQPLKVAKEAETVLFRMNTEEPATRSFQVNLRSVEGAQVWSRASIKARPHTKSGSSIAISIPANRLSTGDYILTLSAAEGSNEVQEINRYFLRIIRQ
jgi:hypothetical protein